MRKGHWKQNILIGKTKQSDKKNLVKSKIFTMLKCFQFSFSSVHNLLFVALLVFINY